MTLKTDCLDYCEDCGRCHDFQSRVINWGELSPKCRLGGLDDEDTAVPCQGDHDEI